MKSKYLKGLQIAIENSKNINELKENLEFFAENVNINIGIAETLLANDKK